MNNCEIILAGFGGQGILFAGKMLAYAAMLKNKQLSWLPSYGPEMRGGTANCHVIIGDTPIGSPIVTEPDILIAMNRPSIDRFENSVKKGGYIFADKSLIGRKIERNDVKAIYVEATETAEKTYGKQLANMVMLGAVLKETGLFSEEEFATTIKKSMPAGKQNLAELNLKSVNAGFELLSCKH